MSTLWAFDSGGLWLSGSHHLLVHPKATRPLNFQRVGGKAKPHQVKQFLRDIGEFQLNMSE